MARTPPQRPSPGPPRGAALLVFLSRLPRWVVLVAVLVIVIVGLAAPGAAGSVLLVALAGLLGWLLMVAWPVLPAGGRALRVTTIALVLGYAVYKIRH